MNDAIEIIRFFNAGLHKAIHRFVINMGKKA